MTQISILGCGWLGFPLAKKLLTDGFSVNGSTTSTEKLQILSEAGIAPFLIDLGKTHSDEIGSLLSGSDILIIAVPPKANQESEMPFPEKIRSLIPPIESAKIKKVIFVSSTSVYADDNSVVTETTTPQPYSKSGFQVLAAESLLTTNLQFETAVIRFGGLIGTDRHPIYQMAGRIGLANPDAPVNLIHQNDCIGIILAIIKNNAWKTFNGVNPYHPTRKEYYTSKAASLGLIPPQFNFSEPSVGKLVTSTKVGAMLDYKFTTDI